VEVEKTAKTGNEISNIGTQAVGMKCIKETKSVNLEEKKVNQLKKVATRPRVQNQPRELKIEEENEAKAIRERMLAKRKSSSALNINTNKSHINSRTVEESAALQFMEFRAKLGRVSVYIYSSKHKKQTLICVGFIARHRKFPKCN
jgi:hypothetical protein